MPSFHAFSMSTALSYENQELQANIHSKIWFFWIFSNKVPQRALMHWERGFGVQGIIKHLATTVTVTEKTVEQDDFLLSCFGAHIFWHQDC